MFQTGNPYFGVRLICLIITNYPTRRDRCTMVVWPKSQNLLTLEIKLYSLKFLNIQYENDSTFARKTTMITFFVRNNLLVLHGNQLGESPQERGPKTYPFLSSVLSPIVSVVFFVGVVRIEPT